MKNIYDSFCSGLKAWPVLRIACAFALIVAFCEFLGMAVVVQFTSVVPTVTDINLLLWRLRLPFGVSRLWDVFLLPLFVYLTFKHEGHRENLYFDELGFLDVSNSETAVDLTQISLFGAMLGGSIFGIVYAAPLFAATFVLWIAIGITLSLLDGFITFFGGLWKRTFSSKTKQSVPADTKL